MMKTLQNSINIVIGFIVGIMLISSFLQVFSRYILESSLSWTEELTRYLFIWSIFLGTSTSIRMNSHIEIDVVKMKLKEGNKRKLEFVNMLLLTGFFILLFILGIKITIENANVVSPAMQMPMYLLYMVIPISSLLAILFCIEKIGRFRREEKE